MSDTEVLNFKITANNDDLKRKLAEARKDIINSAKTAEEQGSKIENVFKRTAAGIKSLGGNIDINALAKSLYDFSNAFDNSMREVSTISNTVTNNMDGFKQQILELGTKVPIAADVAGKALYQIVSAGYDGASGMQVLEVSAKSAVAGLTDVSTAADTITTILNTYKKGAEEATITSDMLFATVKLGKTTFGELGSSISQTLPIAASFGIEAEQVLAAVATLTRSGTPTAQAMAQIRDAINGASKELGDGYFKTHTFQEGLAKIAERAEGSESKLRELMPEIGGMNALLGLTGTNAKTAASDLMTLENAAGETDKAFGKMNSSADNQLTILKNNMLNKLDGIGKGMVDVTADMAGFINNAFDTGAMDNAIATMGALVAVYGGYKAGLIATSAIQQVGSSLTATAEIAELQKLLPLKEASKYADLEKLVTEGKMTQATASKLIVMREEIATRHSELNVVAAQAQAEHAAALVSHKALLERSIASKAMVAQREAELSMAKLSGNAAQIESAQTALATATEERHAAAKALSSSASNVSVTQSKATIAIGTLETFQTNVDTASKNANTGASVILTGAKNALSAAAARLNAVLLANPYAAAAAAIALLGYGIYKVVTADSAAEAALKEYNGEREKALQLEQEHKSKIDGLIQSSTDDNSSTLTRVKSLNGLKKEYPSIFQNYDLESLKLADILQIKHKIAAIDAERNAKEQSKKLADLNEEIATYEKIATIASFLAPLALASPILGSFGGWFISSTLNTAIEKRNLLQKAIADDQAATRDAYQADQAAIKAAEEAKLPQKIRLVNAKEAEVQAQKDFNELSKTYKADKEKFDKKLSLINNESTPVQVDGSSALPPIILENKLEIARNVLQKAKNKVKKIESEPQKNSNPNPKATYQTNNENLQQSIQLETQQSEELDQVRLNTWQSLIDIDQNGFSKVQQQAELNYSKELIAIQEYADEQVKIYQKAELEKYKASHNGSDKGFAPKVESLEDLPEEIRNNVGSRTLAATTTFNQSNKSQIQALLSEYQSYADKRKAIENKFDSDIIAIKSINNDGMYDSQIKQAEEQKEQALSKIDFEDQKEGIDFTLLFGNFDNLTLPSMKSLRDKIKAWIDSAGSQLSPEDFKAVSDAFQKLELGVAQKGLFGEFNKSFKDVRTTTKALEQAQIAYNAELAKSGKKSEETVKAEKTLKDAIDARNASVEKAQQSLGSVANKGKETVGAATDVINIMSDLGIKVPTEISSAIAGIGQMMDGLASMDITNPFSIVTGAIKMVGGLIKGISSLFNGDSKKEKKIQNIQQQIEVLETSYHSLDEAISKSYSTDASKLIEQQDVLLKQQKVLIQNQIETEKSKKNADDGKINELQQQLNNIDKTLEENKEKALNAIFGEDLKSAIDNFASAYADAWTKGEDRSKSAKDTVRQMMRQMVTESIKAAIESSESMEKIREKLKEFYADEVLSESEQNYMYGMAEGLQKELDSKFGWADSLMMDEVPTQEREASKQGIATASQESVDENNGRLTAIQGHTFELSENIKIISPNITSIKDSIAFIRDNAAAQLIALYGIRDNTAPIAEIKSDISALKNDIGTIILTGITIKKQ